MERRSFVIAQIEQNIRVKQQFHPVPQIVPYVPARESPHPKDRLPPPANSGRRNVESTPAFPTLPLLNQGERQTLEFRQFPRIRKVVGQITNQGRRGYCRAWLRTGYRGFPMVSSPAQPTSDGFNATSAVSPLPAPSPEHIAKRYCTNCGTPCRVSARFCPNCGKQLD